MSGRSPSGSPRILPGQDRAGFTRIGRRARTASLDSPSPAALQTQECGGWPGSPFRAPAERCRSQRDAQALTRGDSPARDRLGCPLRRECRGPSRGRPRRRRAHRAQRPCPVAAHRGNGARRRRFLRADRTVRQPACSRSRGTARRQTQRRLQADRAGRLQAARVVDATPRSLIHVDVAFALGP